ncbi:MAG: hypothetical protein ABIJ34_07245 [archaeon]
MSHYSYNGRVDYTWDEKESPSFLGQITDLVVDIIEDLVGKVNK